MKKFIKISSIILLVLAMVYLVSWAILYYSEKTHHKLVFYEYKGVTITRLVKGNSSNFYYGKIKDGNFPQTGFLSISPGMNGYLTFLPEEKVILFYSDFMWKMPPANSESKFSAGFVSSNEADTNSQSWKIIEGNANSTCQISSDVEMESYDNFRFGESEVSTNFSMYESKAHKFFYPIMSLFKSHKTY